jgi:hypothetical protein
LEKLITTKNLIARSEATKQSPFSQRRPRHCEERSDEATPCETGLVAIKHPRYCEERRGEATSRRMVVAKRMELSGNCISPRNKAEFVILQKISNVLLMMITNHPVYCDITNALCGDQALAVFYGLFKLFIFCQSIRLIK